MKKIIILLFLTNSYMSFSQIADAASIVTGLFGGAQPQVVHDPTAKAQTAQLLIATKNSVEKANDQIELLKEAQSKIKKVTDRIRQIEYIQEIILIQQNIFTLSQNTLNDARSMDILYHQRVIASLQGYNALAIATESTLSFANDILTDDFFEMTTAERLEMLKNTRKEVFDHYATAKELSRLIYEVGTLKMLNRAYDRVGAKNKKVIGGYERLGDN